MVGMEQIKMSSQSRTKTASVVLPLLLASVATAAQAGDFSMWTDDQKEDFLRGGEVIAIKELKMGVTNSRRATLSRDGVVHGGHFQAINERKPIFQGATGTELDFTDSYQYNVAAYRLDRMINLNLVPVSVLRKIKGKTGAMTWWIEDVQMMELDRHKKGLTPPNQDAWNDQMYNIRVFNELVYNVDPNLGNVLITDAWLPRPIDFTRAFRRMKNLRAPKNLQRIDRRVYEGLKGLTIEALRSELGDYLPKTATSAILARRDVVVALFDDRIAARGESAVICDRPGH